MQNLNNLIYGTTVSSPPTSILVQPIPDVRERNQIFYLLTKRFFDILLSLIALIILLPVFLATALAIKLDSPGPIFYLHTRIGKNGKKIKLFKFRSMVQNADKLFPFFTPEQKVEFERNFKLGDDFRTTRVGKLIRKVSIDELPQLINILFGDLSIVGPRPVVDSELRKYGFKRDDFLSVKPGLTGHWQTNGRSAATYENRIQMELFYVYNCSLWFDCKIILKTFPAVITGRGAI